jgi:hypothetical protein
VCAEKNHTRSNYALFHTTKKQFIVSIGNESLVSVIESHTLYVIEKMDIFGVN